MDVIMTQAVTVMRKRHQGAQHVTFEEGNRVLALPVGTWEDMGSPDVVTVTVRPGDDLNG
jgi:hypothetical protein